MRQKYSGLRKGAIAEIPSGVGVRFNRFDTVMRRLPDFLMEHFNVLGQKACCLDDGHESFCS